ncbi:cation-transporting P-type ATPase [Methylicorpusculum oleiharenae]|uniref:cation-transporting P-type ATPase n=1 Tax=Methylicorpusculum oleiharenae TaxID=1338687 RepID=UPI0038B30E97
MEYWPVDRDGLATQQAQEGLNTSGPNRLSSPKTRGPLLRFLLGEKYEPKKSLAVDGCALKWRFGCRSWRAALCRGLALCRRI